MELAPRAPFGHSPVDPRTPSYSKHTDGGRFGGRDKQKTSHLRVLLAKTALKNILQTNLDLFPACIDQVSFASSMKKPTICVVFILH
jgi:S-adenosylmethionine synthetase